MIDALLLAHTAEAMRSLQEALDDARDSIDEMLVWGALGLDRNPLGHAADTLDQAEAGWQLLDVADLIEPLLQRILVALEDGWSADWHEEEARRVHQALHGCLIWCARLRHAAEIANT